MLRSKPQEKVVILPMLAKVQSKTDKNNLIGILALWRNACFLPLNVISIK